MPDPVLQPFLKRLIFQKQRIRKALVGSAIVWMDLLVQFKKSKKTCFTKMPPEMIFQKVFGTKSRRMVSFLVTRIVNVMEEGRARAQALKVEFAEAMSLPTETDDLKCA